MTVVACIASWFGTGRWPGIRAAFRFDPRGAVLPMPAMALLLTGGVLTGRPAAAAIAAGAAFSVGFGVTKRLWERRWHAMLVTAAGMTVVAFLGTLAGRDPRVELAATMLMGGLCGALIRRDATLWWAWVQIVIAFLLAAHFPGSAADGIRRALLVATGAAVQVVAAWAMARIAGEPRTIAAAPPAMVTRKEVLLHALRAALCIGAATIVSRMAGIAHGYWAPMTAMLILKPGLRDTGFRGIERIGGTVAGIVLATGLVHLLPDRATLAVAAVLSSGLAFGLQQARYAILSAAITTSVLFMIALAGGEVAGADHDRLLATLIGGAIALAGAAIAPRRVPWRRNAGDRA